jgi:phenylalanyl-tRNA synthetase beta chain
MKVSIGWLKELVDLKVPIEELIHLIPMRTIGLKETNQDFLELDMKGYNRADLLALRGVAYEVAAITDSPVKFSEPKESDYIWVEQSLPSTPVTIDEEIASVQVVAKIEGLKFDKSKDEWVKKLSDSGMRPVNNIADVTNLVMLEYGHPLHSFDAETVKDQTINVRRAKVDEKVTTLDGKVRELTTEDIVLADTEKALDVAGIMGSKETEVSEKTTSILLSASIFDPKMIRRTSQKLGLSSEASKRFYHGLTKKRLLQSVDAAIRMYQELGGKLTSLTITGDTEDQARKTTLRLAKINSLIGVELTSKEVADFLTKLHFNLEKLDPDTTEAGESWVVTSPYWRLDINIEEDLIEEVARIYGYERIQAKELVGVLPKESDQRLFKLIYSLKTTLRDLGLTEVQTYSFYSTKVLEALGFNYENKKILVKVKNPISSETEYLKENGWANLVEVVDKNLRQGFDDIAIFEIGKIYYYNKEGKVDEKYSLSIALMNGTDNPLAELNAIFTKLNEKLNLGVEVSDSNAQINLFHPNRFIQLRFKGDPVGGQAEVHKRVLDKIGINKRVAVLEVSFPKILR